MPANSKLKVGVIGLGIGMAHLKELCADTRVLVHSVCDYNNKLLEEAKLLSPHANFTNDAEEVLNHPAIEAIVIASYDNFHADQTVAALKQNKHVFVEKPLCLNRDELVKIVKCYNRSSALLSSNLILRKNPRFTELKAKISSGALGQIFNIESGYWWGRLQKLQDGWRGRIENYSVTLGGGVHLLDLSQWLINAKITEVQAIGNKIASRDFKFKTPDTVISNLQFNNGAIGRLTVNCGCVHPHFHELNLFGTAGTFRNGDSEAHYYYSSEEQPPSVTHSKYRGNNKSELLRQFITAITEQAPLDVTAQDVFDSIAICLAVDDSVMIKERVIVDYIEASR